MATKLFLVEDPATTHRGTNTAKRAGATSGWVPLAMSLVQPDAGTYLSTVPTVAGTTLGLEYQSGSGPTSGLPLEWLSEPVAADVTISGTITANLWASESDMNANVAINVIIDIVRSDAAGTIVNIVQSTRITEAAVTTRAVNNFTTGMTSGAYTPQTLNRGDRLRIRVVADDAGTMGAAFSTGFSFDGPTAGADGDSYVTFTENLTFELGPGTFAIPTTGAALGQNFGDVAVTNMLAQSFVARGSTLTELRGLIRKIGAPTDNFIVEVWSDSSGLPGASIGSVATIAGTSLTTTLVETTWSGLSISLTPSATYWLVMRRSGSLDPVNYYRWDGGAGSYTAAAYDSATPLWRTSTLAGFSLTCRIVVTTPTYYLTDTAETAITSVTSYSNSFTGSDENPLSDGSTWNKLNSSFTDLQRISNAVSGTSLNNSASYYNVANFGPTVDAYMTLSTIGGATDICGICLRVQGEGGAGTWDGYKFAVEGTATTIYSVLNGSRTVLAGTSSVTWANGDKIGARAEGSLLTLFRFPSGGSVWTPVLSFADPTYAAAGKIALFLESTTVRVDDLVVGSNLFGAIEKVASQTRGSGVVSKATNTTTGWTAPIQCTNGAGGSAIEWYTPQLNAFTLGGMAKANLRTRDDASGASNVSLLCEIARVEADGSSPTVWASWCIAAGDVFITPGEVLTPEAAYTVWVSGDDLAISDGQRLRFRVYLDDGAAFAMASGSTATLFYNGTTAAASGDSYIILPVAVTEYAPPAALDEQSRREFYVMRRPKNTSATRKKAYW